MQRHHRAFVRIVAGSGNGTAAKIPGAYPRWDAYYPPLALCHGEGERESHNQGDDDEDDDVEDHQAGQT